MILKIDEEEFGGHGALLQEGLFASITLFLKDLGTWRNGISSSTRPVSDERLPEILSGSF
ncbi:conserved hypothetical protein [Ricinus communis]|uniref:Uncharacterized protein n=1 Tax=Ricinus communis TaxID=3988 RepID=B9T4C4_RICCO|nr:conserved hypothetical protein [Ricinus communis]